MRRLLALIFAAALPTETLAAARDELWTRCTGSDPEAAVAACTTLIGSAAIGRTERATALYNRGNAHRLRAERSLALSGEAPDNGDAPALSDYGAALELDPALAEAYVNRGILLYRRGRFEAAVRDYAEAIRLRPSLAEAYNNRSLAYHRLNRYEAAKRDFDRTIQLEQHYGNAMINRALGPLRPERSGG